MHFCSGFLFENTVAGPKVGPYILVQQKTYGRIWKLCQFLLNIWIRIFLKFAAALVLPSWLLEGAKQRDWWTCDHFGVPWWETIGIFNFPRRPHVSHIQKKKHPEVRGVRNRLCYLAWSFQKHSRCRCVSKCSRVSWFVLASNVWTQKKITCVLCYWMNLWLVKSHYRDYWKVLKLPFWKKAIKGRILALLGPGSSAIVGVNNSWHWETPGIWPFGTASVPDGRAHHAQRL